MNEPCRSFGAFHRILDKPCVVALVAPAQQVEVADDDRQHVVEVMRQATGEMSQGFHFLCLAKLVLQLFPVLRGYDQLRMGHPEIAERAGQSTLAGTGAGEDEGCQGDRQKDGPEDRGFDPPSDTLGVLLARDDQLIGIALEGPDGRAGFVHQAQAVIRVDDLEGATGIARFLEVDRLAQFRELRIGDRLQRRQPRKALGAIDVECSRRRISTGSRSVADRNGLR